MISQMEEEIASPELARDYEAMNAKCTELEQKRAELDSMMEEWADLSDEI